MVEGIRRAIASARITEHSLIRMIQHGIAVEAVVEAVRSQRAEVIEDYPNDPRGPSCLILGWEKDGRPIHVVVSRPPDIWIITAYYPDARWESDYRRRKSGA